MSLAQRRVLRDLKRIAELQKTCVHPKVRRWYRAAEGFRGPEYFVCSACGKEMDFLPKPDGMNVAQIEGQL